jgi:antitoxin ParD1/3/4/toxin ParE1/3/4
MRRVKVTRQARRDLLAIWVYIGNDSIEAADRVVDEIQASFQKIAEMPGIGHTKAEVNDPRYRFWRVYSYLIVYRADTKPVQIIRIVSGHRDLKRLFD